MALFNKMGVITSPASNGTQTVSGLGFRPTLILFFYSQQTAAGSSANASVAFGTCDGNLNQFSQGAISEHAQATTVTGNVYSSVSAVRYDNYSQVAQYEAAVSAIAFDSFTLNWTTTTLSGAQVYYIAFGGSDMQATVGGVTSPTVTGNFVVTSSLANTPSAVIMLNNRSGTGSSSATQSYFGIGAATGSSNQWSMFSVDQTAATVIKSAGYQSTASVMDTLGSGGGTALDTATFTSMNSNGFTVNETVTNGAGVRWRWIATGGISFAVGSISQKTSTGTQATTGLGFKPTALMLVSDNRVASGSTTTPMSMCLGVTNATSSFALWSGSTYTSGASVCSCVSSTSNVWQHYTAGGASPTLVAAASLSSFDSGGFTLNFGTADATARQILYFAWGPATTKNVGNFLDVM